MKLRNDEETNNLCGWRHGGAGERDSKLTKARSKSVCHQTTGCKLTAGRERRYVNYWSRDKKSKQKDCFYQNNNWPIATVTFTNQKIQTLVKCIALPIDLICLSTSNWQIIVPITALSSSFSPATLSGYKYNVIRAQKLVPRLVTRPPRQINVQQSVRLGPVSLLVSWKPELSRYFCTWHWNWKSERKLFGYVSPVSVSHDLIFIVGKTVRRGVIFLPI